jgi:hypothetical protein
MPMISEAQLAIVQNKLASKDNAIDKLKAQKARERIAGLGFQVGEAFLGALGVGFVRGKLEKDGKAFALGPVDGELLIAGGLIFAGAMPKWFGKYGEHLLNAGVGVLGHYAGQMGRALGKGQTFTPVIGMLPDHVGMDPTYVGRSSLGAHRGVGAANDLASALAASAA